MLRRERLRHHAMTDRLEDFGNSEIRDQQPEDLGFLRYGAADVRSRSGPALHQTAILQIAKRD
jgi:hypothetical protein